MDVIGKLIEVGLEYLKDEVKRQTGMNEKLETLRNIHYPKIQSVVAYASRQPQIRDETLNKLLWQLRDAIDEAEDVFDDLKYRKHEKQLAKNKKLRKVRSIMKYIKKIGKRALKIDPNFERLEVAVQKLEKVSADVDTFRHLVKDEKREQQEKPRETGSMSVNDLIGQTQEKDSVLEWLKKPSNEHQTYIPGCRNISLLSIVGHGGMGKTTLLRHVYEDAEITTEFELKMWVYVSNNFDAKKVIVDMFEYLNKERPHLETLATAQESLKSAVMSKKFLLVLDDIWEDEDESKWEDVLAPLTYGKFGSKILVTTRMDSAAFMIANVMGCVLNKKDVILRLKGLKENECLQLLNRYAFAGENPDDHRKLKSIAGEIVKKLSGSPLEAKIMGGVLSSSLDESHWMEILKSDFRYAESTQSMSTLRLSYISLPKHLQSCFTFCCIFPQDHKFDKDDLVRMWIALGFIQSYNSETNLEDIGGKYFDVLAKKSYFHKIDDFKYYKIHNSVHKLAQSVSECECFKVEGDEGLPSKIPETIRHLSVETNNLEVLKKMTKFKNLRTLYISYNEDNQDYVDVLAEIFKASISIRVLYIEDQHLKIIPEAIGNLIHLRYFNLFRTKITLLPRSLSNLYHMQFIICNSWLSSISQDFLPRDMNNLSNLYYLELPWDEFPGMYGIGKLNSLQKLDGFYVKNKIGYRIGELESMNDLRQLRIKFLENVKDAEEICSVKLYEKENLTDLSLEWGDNKSRKFTHLDEKVLDKLQPHKSLKSLTISAYMGIKHAIWMKETDLIPNLKCIKLIGCLKLQTLPLFGQLPLLEELHLVDLDALEDWFDAAAAENRLFPCLTNLYLENCPNLKELPYLPPKLEILKIKNIGRKISKSIPVRHFPNKTYIFMSDKTTRASRYYGETPYYYNNMPYSYFAQPICLGGDQEVETYENYQLISNKLSIKDPSVLLMEPLRSITSVLELTIESNSELVSFPNDVEQWFLKVGSSLGKLVFKDLESLQSLPSSLKSLSSLKILKVKDVPQLQVLPNLPASLEELKLRDLESLQSLPSSLESLSSLKILKVKDVPQLQVLPNLPTSLEELKLRDLESLQSLPSSLQSLSSLAVLKIKWVPQLQVLPNLPASLEELELDDLESLNCLPSLSSLKKLYIYDVPQLRELPDLPPSLKSLEVNHRELPGPALYSESLYESDNACNIM